MHEGRTDEAIKVYRQASRTEGISMPDKNDLNQMIKSLN